MMRSAVSRWLAPILCALMLLSVLGACKAPSTIAFESYESYDAVKKAYRDNGDKSFMFPNLSTLKLDGSTVEYKLSRKNPGVPTSPFVDCVIGGNSHIYGNDVHFRFSCLEGILNCSDTADMSDELEYNGERIVHDFGTSKDKEYEYGEWFSVYLNGCEYTVGGYCLNMPDDEKGYDDVKSAIHDAAFPIVCELIDASKNS